jgi:hypothetical protein
MESGSSFEEGRVETPVRHMLVMEGKTKTLVKITHLRRKETRTFA